MFSKPHSYFLTAENYTKTLCSHNILKQKGQARSWQVTWVKKLEKRLRAVLQRRSGLMRYE